MDNPSDPNPKLRDTLSVVFGVGGFTVILLLGALVIFRTPGSEDHVLGEILPLVASWVGTVIAYYFSRENLAAATSSVSTLAKGMVDLQRLASIPVKARMIPRSEIATLPTAMTAPPSSLDKTLLKDITTSVAASKTPMTRLPIFQVDGSIEYLIHLSVLNEFLARSALAGASVAALTFADLLADPVVRTAANGSFGVVSGTSTLDRAKAVMDSKGHCEDVFVTEDGKASSPVIGWLTDDTIWAAARV
jgi:hypothetical protein